MAARQDAEARQHAAAEANAAAEAAAVRRALRNRPGSIMGPAANVAGLAGSFFGRVGGRGAAANPADRRNAPEALDPGQALDADFDPGEESDLADEEWPERVQRYVGDYTEAEGPLSVGGSMHGPPMESRPPSALYAGARA